MTSLEPYVLRYWEKEFPILSPRKNRGGTRLYTEKDIEVINRIKHLRHKEKLTISGTRQKLVARRQPEVKEELNRQARVRTLVGKMRREIDALRRLFEE